MQSYYLQRLSCSSLHVSSDTHASTGTTTALFLINAVKYKELSQPNISEALFSLGKWWTVELKRCVGKCWFTLPFSKKLSSLKCVLCALIKINYIALKSKIFWFNKHFFQQKVSLLDNLQMFDLVLIQNCLHCHCNGRNSCSSWECSQQKPSNIVPLSPSSRLSQIDVRSLYGSSEYVSAYFWELIHSHWSSPTHWPARTLPWSSVLDTYRISENWLSRFMGIKMHKQTHIRHWLNCSLGGKKPETIQAFCRLQADEKRKIFQVGPTAL